MGESLSPTPPPSSSGKSLVFYLLTLFFGLLCSRDIELTHNRPSAVGLWQLGPWQVQLQGLVQSKTTRSAIEAKVPTKLYKKYNFKRLYFILLFMSICFFNEVCISQKLKKLEISGLWYIRCWWLFIAYSCWSENWILTMTHSFIQA